MHVIGKDSEMYTTLIESMSIQRDGKGTLLALAFAKGTRLLIFLRLEIVLGSHKDDLS